MPQIYNFFVQVHLKFIRNLVIMEKMKVFSNLSTKKQQYLCLINRKQICRLYLINMNKYKWEENQMGNDVDRYHRFLDGDDNGLREIIDIYYNGLTLYINGIVNNPFETEDIVQETFVKLAIKKPKFQVKYEFKTWLFTIARNIAYNYLKRYNDKYSDKPIDEYITLSDGVNIEYEYLKTQQNIEIHKAMKKLNPDYFQVLYLMYFENLDTEKIAHIMHKSKRQIGDLLYQAKKSLKSILEKAGFHYEDF